MAVVILLLAAVGVLEVARDGLGSPLDVAIAVLWGAALVLLVLDWFRGAS